MGKNDSCQVVVRCSYALAGKIHIWNVEIDGKKYHKGFTDDTTDEQVLTAAEDDCKLDMLYANNWVDDWIRDCD